MSTRIRDHIPPSTIVIVVLGIVFVVFFALAGGFKEDNPQRHIYGDNPKPASTELYDPRVLALESSRNLFRDSLRDSGLSCTEVTEVFFSGRSGSIDMFSIRCANSNSYLVSTNRYTGETKATECDVVQAVGIAQCFQRLEN